MARRRFDPASTTLLQAAGVKVGPRKAAGVVYFVLQWRDVRDQLGRDITIAEFIQHSDAPERTVFNRLTMFRRVFDGRPGLTPNDVLQVHDAVEFEQLTGPLGVAVTA